MLDIDVVGVPEAEALIDTLLLVEMDQLDDGVDVTDGVNEFGVVEEVGVIDGGLLSTLQESVTDVPSHAWRYGYSSSRRPVQHQNADVAL